MDIVNQTGEDVEVAVIDTPTREEVLEGLRSVRAKLLRRASERLTDLTDLPSLDRAIAYLAEDYAGRMEAVAEVWEATGNSSLCARANGMREAARMLREKDSR